MINHYIFEKELSKFKAVLFSSHDTKKLRLLKEQLLELDTNDFMRLLKDIDAQQGETIANLMKQGVDTICINPLGKFISKDKMYIDKGVKLSAYFDRVNKSNNLRNGGQEEE